MLADGVATPCRSLSPLVAASLSSLSSDTHSNAMGLLNTVSKTVMTFGLVTGPVMLAAGLGLIEDCPAVLIKGNGGTGADKGGYPC